MKRKKKESPAQGIWQVISVDNKSPVFICDRKNGPERLEIINPQDSTKNLEEMKLSEQKTELIGWFVGKEIVRLRPSRRDKMKWVRNLF